MHFDTFSGDVTYIFLFFVQAIPLGTILGSVWASFFVRSASHGSPIDRLLKNEGKN
jgi:hypothetical protein